MGESFCFLIFCACLSSVEIGASARCPKEYGQLPVMRIIVRERELISFSKVHAHALSTTVNKIPFSLTKIFKKNTVIGYIS